jgi:hypothetical protein
MKIRALRRSKVLEHISKTQTLLLSNSLRKLSYNREVICIEAYKKCARSQVIQKFIKTFELKRLLGFLQMLKNSDHKSTSILLKIHNRLEKKICLKPLFLKQEDNMRACYLRLYLNK